MPNHDDVDKEAERVQRELERELERQRELERRKAENERYLETLRQKVEQQKKGWKLLSPQTTKWNLLDYIPSYTCYSY